jgi:hypothetical protein
MPAKPTDASTQARFNKPLFAFLDGIGLYMFYFLCKEYKGF